MPEGNFEKAGVQLEVKGFSDYINNLKKVDDAHISASGTADTLAQKLTNLEKVAQNVFKAINTANVNLSNIGVVEFGNNAEKAGDQVQGFGKDVSEGAKALQKIQVISQSIEVFERLTTSLIQNTASLQTGFERIQTAIAGINMDKLTGEAARAAENIGKLADQFGRLEKSLGGSGLVTNLGKLIPLLLAAGDIRKLGDVGIGIRSILSSLQKIDKIPDFEKNQGNFNALLDFMQKLSKIKIPQDLGSNLIEIGNALEKFRPGIHAVSKVELQAHTVAGIEKLLQVFTKYNSLDAPKLVELGNAVQKLGIGFRSFAQGAAGDKFSGAALGIAKAVEQLLTSLTKFMAENNVAKAAPLIEELGKSLREFARGASSLGRDFDKTFANVPKSIEVLVESIFRLRDALNSFDDLNVFLGRLGAVTAAFSAITRSFQSLSRSESIRKNLKDQIDTIIDVLRRLGSEDLQLASKNIQALVGPIRDLGEALKILKGQKVGRELAENLGKVGTGFGIVVEYAGKIVAVLAGATRGFLSLGVAIGKIAVIGVVNGFKLLATAIGALAKFLIQLPIQIVIAGFKALTFVVQALIVPVQFLIGLIGKLATAFTSLFKNRSANVSESLGLKESQKDIQIFEGSLNTLKNEFNQVNSYTSTASRGVLEFGNSADKASADVLRLDNRLDGLNNRGRTLGSLFSGGDLLRIGATFKAIDIAGDLVTDTLYGMTTGLRNVIGEAVTATSNFEQLTLQLTSLQAKEAVAQGLFPDVPTALSDGIELLQGNVKDLTNEFRILAIQSPFETSDVSNAFRLAQAFGFTTEEGKELVRTLVDAGSALGFTGNDLTEVARVFGQIRTTGKLMAQDMNQLASRGINVKRILEGVNGATIDWENTTVDADQAIDRVIRSLQADFAGAAARSASSIEGLIGSFKSFREEALRTFAQPIVEGLRPIFVGLADTLFTPEVFSRIEAAGQRAFEIIEKVLLTISTIGGVVNSIFQAIPKPFIDFLVLLGQAAGIAAAATTALIGLQFAVGIVAAAIVFILHPLGVVAGLTFVVTQGVTAMTSEFMTFGETLTAIGTIITQAFELQTVETQILRIAQLPQAIQPVVNVLNNMTVEFSKLIEIGQALGRVFAEAFSLDVIGLMHEIISLDEALKPIAFTIANLGVAFGRFYQYAVTVAQGIYNNVISAFNALSVAIVDTFNNIGQNVSNVITTIFDMASGVSDFLSSLIEQVGEFGIGVVEAFASGMSSAVNLVVDAVTAIADAIAWLLAPGSPPRALPEIDKWGEAAAGEFVAGMANADVTPIGDLSTEITNILKNFKVPQTETLEELFPIMGWTQDEAGNVVDGLGNIILSQDQLAKSASNVADELARVNSELEALDREQAIQKQQNLVNNLKAALSQTNLSQSNRMVLEQQLKRAELELRRLQLQAEEEGLVDEGGGIGSGGRGRSGSGRSKTPKTKTPKGVDEPDQRFPKIDKAIKKTGKKMKEVLDLAVPDTSGIANAFGSPDTGTGLLGRITESFNKAKENIGASVEGIRQTIITTFTNLQTQLSAIVTEIIRIAGELGTAFSTAFGELENEGAIAGGIAALATATYLSGGWGVLLTIAAGISAIGAAWAIASGQVTLDLPDNLKALETVVARMKEGFKGAQEQEIFLPGGVVKVKSGSNTGLAEAILGFDVEKIPESFGAVLAAIQTEVTNIFTEIDKAISAAFTAYETGSNPVTTFFGSLFDIEQIRQTLTNELQGLGELIASIFSGELSKAMSGQQEAFYDASIGSWNVREVAIGENSFIVQFIMAQITSAKDQLSKIDWEAEFAEIRANIEKGLNGLFGNIEESQESSFLTSIKDFITEIQKLEIVNWTQISSDMRELGAAFSSLMGFSDDDTGAGGGSAAAGGAVVTATGLLITALIGLIETLSKVPSVAESAITIVDTTLRAIESLITAIGSIAAPAESIRAFRDFGAELKGIFDELGEINTDVFLVVNETLKNVVAIVGLMQGVEDVDAFLESKDSLLLGLNGLAGVLVAIAQLKLVSMLPPLITFNKNSSTISKVFIGLTAISYAAQEFDRQNEDIDWAGMTDFVNNLTTFLLVQQSLSALTGGLVGGKGAAKVWQQLTKIGMFKALDAFIKGITFKSVSSAAINSLKKIGPLLTGTVFPWLRTIFEHAKWFTTNNLIPRIAARFATLTPLIATIWGNISAWITGLGTAVSGASAGAIAGWAAIILAIVSTIAAFVNAWQKDIGNIKTEFLASITGGLTAITDFWNALVDIIKNFGNDELRFDAIDRGDEALNRLFAWGMKFNRFFQIGTSENTNLFISTVQGFFDIIDTWFDTDYAAKLELIFGPIREFFKTGILGNVQGTDLDPFSAITQGLLRLVAINIEPLDGIILRILSVVDAIYNLTAAPLQKASIAFQLIAELTQFATNPLANAGRIGTITSLIAEFVALDQTAQPMSDFAQRYKDFTETFRNDLFFKPKIEVEPEFIGPLAPNESRGGIGGETSLSGIGAALGLTEDSVNTVPVTLAPEFSTDNETFNTALTQINTDATTALTGLNTTVSTQTLALQTQINTDYAAIAATIGQAGVDGAAGFVTGISTLPTDIETPIGDLIGAINAYGGESGDITIAGSDLGVDFAEGYISGIDSKKTDLINAVTAYVNAGLIQIPRVQESSSPSKVTRGFGRDFGEGFLKGIADKESALKGVAARFAQAGVDTLAKTIGSSRNQAAINRVLDALIADVFQEDGLQIDFSNWEIISDSEIDQNKRALDKATGIFEEFGNTTARAMNQIFDTLVSDRPELAPDLFGTQEILDAATKQIDLIFEGRNNILAKLTDEGKADFDRLLLGAFTSADGVKEIATTFLEQFSDEDLFNLPKIFGSIDVFIAQMQARLSQKAQEGDGFAMSLMGGFADLDAALREQLQIALDAAQKEAEGEAASGVGVGNTVSNNVATGVTSPEALGGINTAVTTLTTTLVSAIQTEFAKITETVTTQGGNSATGFITGVDTINDLLPTSKDKIVATLEGFAEELKETGLDLGNDWSEGYAAGMITVEALKTVYDAAFKVGQTAKQGTADGQNSASPSKDAMQLGKDFGDGYVIGITNTLKEVEDASFNLAQASAISIAQAYSDTAPIISKAVEGAVKTGTFWIDETQKVEPPVDSDQVDEVTESMNALERATETAQKIFDSFADSFGNSFDSVFDKFLEMNPEAIANIWDIGPIRDAATSIAEQLRTMIDELGEELTPGGQSAFSDLLKSLFGDEDTIQTLIDSFISSFDEEELSTLPDAAEAINTFIRQIEDVLLEDDDYEGWLKEMGLTDDVAGGFTQIAERLRQGIQDAIDALKEAEEAENAPERTWIDDMFGTPEAQEQSEQVGEALTAGIAAGITSPSSINGLATAANIAIESFLNELRNAGDIHSPSRLTMKLAGEPLVDGIIVGMRNRIPNMLKTARMIGDTVAHSFDSNDMLRQNSLDQKVNLKYNGLVSSMPDLFQKVNRGVIDNANGLKDSMLLSGESNARTGMLTNYSVIHNTTNTQDEYHLHMDVDRSQLPKVRKGFRVARQLGIN